LARLCFAPRHKMLDVPSTGIESLRLPLKIGRKAGLKYVYAGNVQVRARIPSALNAEKSSSSARRYRILKNYLMGRDIATNAAQLCRASELTILLNS